MRLYQVLCMGQIPFLFRVDLGVRTMKGYYTLPRALELEPHHRLQFSVIPRIPHSGESYLSAKHEVGVFQWQVGSKYEILHIKPKLLNSVFVKDLICKKQENINVFS